MGVCVLLPSLTASPLPVLPSLSSSCPPLPLLLLPPPSPSSPLLLQVSRIPKELLGATCLCFSSDSSQLFASSSGSSVVVVALGQLECKHVHTLRPKAGETRRLSEEANGS